MKARRCGSFTPPLPKPVLVGLEATGSMFWFLRLLEELGIEYRVGHPAAIRKAEDAQAETRPARRGVDPGGWAGGEAPFPQILAADPRAKGSADVVCGTATNWCGCG